MSPETPHPKSNGSNSMTSEQSQSQPSPSKPLRPWAEEAALELIDDMAEASRELVQTWTAIEKIAPKKRYSHLISRHQDLIDRAERLTPYSETEG